MTLAAQLGIDVKEASELVAFVGAGGKSTLLLSLGRKLSDAGCRVLLTTTTKMGADQIPDWAMRIDRPEEVTPALSVGATPFLVGSVDKHKIVGVSPEVVDTIYAATPVDVVLVEADGARSRKIKTPGPHEPVVPSSTTLAVVVASVQAVGERISEVAHRPERVADVLGTGLDHEIRPKDVASIVGDPEGGLARIPSQARVVVALTGSTDKSSDDPANEIVDRLEASDRIDRVALIPGLAATE